MVSVIMVLGLLMTTAKPVAADAEYMMQVGAWGDEASRGNKGVRAEIQTRAYNVFSPVLTDSFWVGSTLQNDAFIQFGYELQVGRYCLYAHRVGDHTVCLGSYDTFRGNDPRWFWEYWPYDKVIDFYCGNGPAASAGSDGSWHLYTIQPNFANGWDFLLDGKIVQSFNNYASTTSPSLAKAVAEEVSSVPSASGTLGPVGFRNLSYLKDDGWHQVKSLRAISGCSVLNPNCEPDIKLPYGVTLAGPNDFIAGTGQQLRKNNDLLWVQQYKLTILSQFPASGEGTYDMGSRAHFSTTTPQPSNEILHQWMLDGWYDENGNLVTRSAQGSIMMDRPHTIRAEWYPAVIWTQVITIIVAAIAITFGLFMIMRRRYQKPKKATLSVKTE